MARKPATARKVIKVREVRMPLKKLLHGKSPQEAIKAINEWRLQFNEDEILYKRRVTIKWADWGDTVYAIVERDETDAEYKKRRDAAEAARLKREQNAQAKAQKAYEAKLKQEQLLQKIKAMTFEEYAKLSGSSFEDILKTIDIDYNDLDRLE